MTGYVIETISWRGNFVAADQGVLMKPAILAILFSVFATSPAWAASPTSTVSVDGKEILTNANGMTAYTFDPDTGTSSTCYNGCAIDWPPILLPAGETLSAPLGVTTRTDGTQQVTYNGHPIYLFIGDKKSGDTSGDGEDGVWHIIPVNQPANQ
jgi:predicted lipoprotein with Yx(FWY)xxD motif